MLYPIGNWENNVFKTVSSVWNVSFAWIEGNRYIERNMVPKLKKLKKLK